MINLQFQYKPVFKINFENNYFKDNLLRKYVVKPAKETEKLLDRLGFLYKVTPMGIDILADSSRSEQLIMRLEQLMNNDCKLSFLIFMKDPFFKNYTDIVFNTISSVYYFSNKTLGTSSSGKLHKSDYVSEEDLYELNNDYSLKGLENTRVSTKEKGTPFSLVEIELSNEIIDQITDGLVDNEIIGFNYSISFNSRSVIWKYIVIPGYAKKINGLKIISQNTGKSVKFSEAKQIKIKDKEAIMFESESPMRYQEFYDYSFQLKRGAGENGGKTIIKKMQFAPLDIVKPLNKKDPNKYCSEIYVYI